MYTLSFNNLKGTKKIRDSFVGKFTIIRLTGKHLIEVKLTKELCAKHPVFPVSLVKPYHQIGKDMFPSRDKIHTPQDIVEAEVSPGPVKKIIKSRKIRLNGKHCIQYLVIFKNHKSYSDICLAEEGIPHVGLHLRQVRASRRAELSHQ
ncbi:hypothetical protein O181_015250 [Austropuccinia psidii MF-1]|uniref:Uncharacterized protein n=1 Tax=Austropuccinia psidii MF-1 TaxID=1389203 RepID=A0A9Q3C2J4_9BASI|nr:hypothetical protein [Austropuccinia psidii MF-1]